MDDEHTEDDQQVDLEVPEEAADQVGGGQAAFGAGAAPLPGGDVGPLRG